MGKSQNLKTLRYWKISTHPDTLFLFGKDAPGDEQTSRRTDKRTSKHEEERKEANKRKTILRHVAEFALAEADLKGVRLSASNYQAIQEVSVNQGPQRVHGASDLGLDHDFFRFC